MQRESYTSITHFLDDVSYRSWVVSGEDNAEWAQWLRANPEKSRLAQEARYLILAIGDAAAHVTSEETDRALDKNWSIIQQRSVRSFTFGSWWQAAAAVMIFALGLAWYISRKETGSRPLAVQKRSTERPAAREVDFYNDSKVAKLVNLEDGSTVILQPGGHLSYPAKFAAGKREVHLSGEAFFEISKNRHRPFLVYTNDIVTEVVGTSFRIKAADDHPEVEVFVKTGEVHVRPIKIKDNKAVENVVLLPNQSVSFLKSQNLFEKPENKDIPKRAIEYLNFDFADAPVRTIFSAIENAYGVTIDYPEAALQDCHLSTSLSDEPLLSKLRIVCESISSGTRFRMEGNQVIIESNGCN